MHILFYCKNQKNMLQKEINDWTFKDYFWLRKLVHDSHSWNPPPSPPTPQDMDEITKRHRGGGGYKFLLLERGGGVTFLLLYSSVTFNACVGKVRFPLLLFRSSVFWGSHSRISEVAIQEFQPGIICPYISDPF